jgi:transposase InsO family protein
VVTPAQQRAAADFITEKFEVSERRASAVLGRSRSTLRYRVKSRENEPPIRKGIRDLARKHPRYGYRRIHAMLLRKGWTINLKRVRRLWIDMGLKRTVRLKKVKKLGKKPGVGGNSCTARPAKFKNDVWTCDFIHDRTLEGGTLKWLTLVDEYTRECLVLHAARTITGGDVRRILAGVIGRRGRPRMIRSDNGSEFVCEAVAAWLPKVGTEPIPVAAGSPWQNGYIESFHSRLRDEFMERHEFETIADARAKGAMFRREYNRIRPHGSLDYKTPEEFSKLCDATKTIETANA